MGAQTLDWVLDAAGDGSVDVAQRHPMPCPRLACELVAATTVLAGREVDDARHRALRTGALLASNWVHGVDAAGPVTARDRPWPSLADATTEYAVAALVGAGFGRLPEVGPCDAGRLVARGVEAYLLWYCWPDTPVSPLLDAQAAPGAVLTALAGDVGHGPHGLYGAAVGTARLPALPGARVSVDGRGRLVMS